MRYATLSIVLMTAAALLHAEAREPSSTPVQAPQVTIDDIKALQKSPHIINYAPGQKLQLPPEQYKSFLTALQFDVMFNEGTEAAFQNEYHDLHETGTFISRASGAPLFRSENKFDSGTGWPSFDRPVRPDAVLLSDPTKDAYGRIEVKDSVSGTHLGHVFNDGPTETGKRFCMDSASLIFVPDKK